MDRQWGDIDQAIRDTAYRITEITLVEQRCHDGTTRWYFAPREELPPRR